MTLEEFHNDKKELRLNLIKLMNDFETKWGQNILQLDGKIDRYNGSNNAGGTIIDIGLHATL